MPYTTITTLGTITSTWANSNVRDQVVTPFASSAARDAAISSPVAGMVEYLTSNDANEGLTTRTSAGTWRLPWSMPWGVASSSWYATITSNTTGITTAADVTGLTCTPTLVANRLYRIHTDLTVLQSTSAGVAQIYLVVGGVTKQNSAVTLAAAGYGTIPITFLLSGASAGATTIKVQASTTAGTVGSSVSASSPGILLVEDIGPNGAPA